MAFAKTNAKCTSTGKETVRKTGNQVERLLLNINGKCGVERA